MDKRYDDIFRKADRLVQRCGTRDPITIANEIGIYIHHLNGLSDLLGMYTYRNKERHILLNADLDDIHRRMVAAHELGHDALHREQAKVGSGLQEFSLFYMQTRMEYGANAFASHILIDNEKLVDRLKDGYDVIQASCAFDVNINLMLVKLHELHRLGYSINPLDVPRSDFMGRIGIGKEEIYL